MTSTDATKVLQIIRNPETSEIIAVLDLVTNELTLVD